MNLPPPDLPEPVAVPAATAVPEPEPVPKSPVAVGEANPYAPPLTPVAVAAEEKRDVWEVSESLGSLVREAFLYPLRMGGPGTIVIGTVVLVGVVVMAYAPILGIPFFFGGLAYVAAYYFDVIYATLNGQDEAPPWPELSSWWDDVVIPGVQMLGIWVLSSALQIWAAYSAGGDDFAFSPLYLLGSVLKWLYFPMATLAVVCHGSVWAALPHRVVPAVLRCLPGYLVCAGAFAVAEIAQVVFAALFGMIPVLGWFLPWVGYMYVMLVQARLTGLIYLRYRERIPW